MPRETRQTKEIQRGNRLPGFPFIKTSEKRKGGIFIQLLDEFYFHYYNKIKNFLLGFFYHLILKIFMPFTCPHCGREIQNSKIICG